MRRLRDVPVALIWVWSNLEAVTGAEVKARIVLLLILEAVTERECVVPPPEHGGVPAMPDENRVRSPSRLGLTTGGRLAKLPALGEHDGVRKSIRHGLSCRARATRVE